MKFTQHASGTAHAVTGYAPGEVRLGDRVLRRSALVSADALDEAWPVQDVQDLGAALDAVLRLDPEVVVLGTGVTQQFPAPSVFAAIAARGIGFEVMDNGAACRTYNVLLAEGRRVVLALIL